MLMKMKMVDDGDVMVMVSVKAGEDDRGGRRRRTGRGVQRNWFDLIWFDDNNNNAP